MRHSDPRKAPRGNCHLSVQVQHESLHKWVSLDRLEASEIWWYECDVHGDTQQLFGTHQLDANPIPIQRSWWEYNPNVANIVDIVEIYRIFIANYIKRHPVTVENLESGSTSPLTSWKQLWASFSYSNSKNLKAFRIQVLHGFFLIVVPSGKPTVCYSKWP